MQNLSDDLLTYIFKYLSNEDVYKVSYLCKYYYNLLTSEYFIEYMDTRYHPMVFNILDNYCRLCNRGIICINFEEDFETSHCLHHSF